MTRPNIVCVSIDSLRYDFTSLCDANRFDTTPFLASLAESSRVFDACITPSVWTLPVHTSIFSGLFPPEHGVYTESDILGNQPTIGELLSEEGYSLGAFIGNSWIETGGILREFDTIDNAAEIPAPSTSEFGDLIGKISPRLRWGLARLYHGQGLYRKWVGDRTPSREQSTRGQRTINALEDAVGSIDEPFFWLVHFNDAHWKYRPPSPFHKKFSGRSAAELVYNAEYWQDNVYGSRSGRLNTVAGNFEPPESQIDIFRELYRGAVRYCDDLLKKVVGMLKTAGVWDETILIVFGDHGDSFGEDGVIGHTYSVDDAISRVPLLIRDPFDTVSTGRSSSPVSLTDLYPTILNIAGISPPTNSGVNLAEDSRDLSFSFFDMSDHKLFRNASEFGVRQEELPEPVQYLVWKSPSEREIFLPTKGIWKDRNEPDREIRKQLDEFLDSMQYVPTESEDLDSDIELRLEKLGYLRD